MLLLDLLLVLLIVAVLAGFLGSLAGLGGGVILVPVMVAFLGVPFLEAVGASAVSVLATSATTGAAYVRDHLTDLRIGMFLEIATVPGALIGATATLVLVHTGLEPFLLAGLGILLLATIPSSLRRRDEEILPRRLPTASPGGSV